MFCPSCGTPAESGTPFCGNCGAALTAPPAANSINVQQPNEQFEKVKSFLRNNLLDLVGAVLGKPNEGTNQIFASADNEAYFQSIVLYALTSACFILVPYLCAGGLFRNDIPFEYFFKAGLLVFIILFLISILTFVIKAITGKPDFKRELLTGAICGIPLTILVMAISIVWVFNSNSSIEWVLRSLDRFQMQGIIVFIIAIYSLFMMINIVQQSLKASKVNDGLSWYLSPLVIYVSFYIAFKIGVGLFDIH